MEPIVKHGAVSDSEAEKMRADAFLDIDGHPLYRQLSEKYEDLVKQHRNLLKQRSGNYAFAEYSTARMKSQDDWTFEEAIGASAMGLPGEVGEVVEHIKKWFYHGKQLDKDYLVKELGDVLWYITYLANALGSSLEEVAKTNDEKLRLRYPDGFSKDAASLVPSNQHAHAAQITIDDYCKNIPQ